MDAEEINSELRKALMQRLEEFGDGVLGIEEKKRKKDHNRKDTSESTRKKKRKQISHTENGANNPDDPVMKNKKKLKKKRHKHDKIAHAGSRAAEAKGAACRQPKVIEFVEPGRKRAKTSGEPKTQKMVNANIEERRSANQGIEDFKEIAREVREFGVTGFSRKEQRKYAQQKAQALGAKAPKSQKMPYPILKYAKKVRQQREKEQQELEKAMGIFTKKKSKTKKDSASVRNHGRWVDRSANGLEATIGRYKGGVQHISRADLKKFKSNKR